MSRFYSLRRITNCSRTRHNLPLLHLFKLSTHSRSYDTQFKYQKSLGFTLIELLAVIVMMGILATFSVAGWLSFVENYALSSAEDRLYRNLREAQSNAKRDKLIWQVSLRTDDAQRLSVAIHQAGTVPPEDWWQAFDDRVRLLEADTTFRKDRNNIYYLQFNTAGHINGQLGRATFTTASNVAAGAASVRKRCVFTSTLIGTLRKAQGRDCTR